QDGQFRRGGLLGQRAQLRHGLAHINELLELAPFYVGAGRDRSAEQRRIFVELQFAAEKAVAAGQLARLQGAFIDQSAMLDVGRPTAILVYSRLLEDVLHTAQRTGPAGYRPYDIRNYNAKLSQQ